MAIDPGTDSGAEYKDNDGRVWKVTGIFRNPSAIIENVLTGETISGEFGSTAFAKFKRNGSMESDTAFYKICELLRFTDDDHLKTLTEIIAEGLEDGIEDAVWDYLNNAAQPTTPIDDSETTISVTKSSPATQNQAGYEALKFTAPIAPLDDDEPHYTPEEVPTCPFCHHKPYLEPETCPYSEPGYKAVCKNEKCEMNPETPFCDDPKDALKIWSNRCKK